MRLYTLPLLAILALAAQVASLPRHAVAVTDLEKKLTKVVEEVLKKDVQSQEQSSEQELVEEANEVVDVDNQLKKVPGVPVKVIEEGVKPTQKKDYGIEKGNDAGGDVVSTVKRQEADIEHPGEPQRQEHDTQTPQNSNIEQDTITAIKQSLTETQIAFKQGFEGLTTKLQGAFSTNEQLVTFKKSLENLQTSFYSQLEQVNNSLQGYFSAEKPAAESAPEKETPMEEAEKKLDNIEEKIKDEVNSFKVIPEVSAVRASPFHRQDNSSAEGNPTQWEQIQQQFQSFTATMQSYFQTFQTNMQNMMNQNQTAEAAPGAQLDESSTQRPTIWGGLQSIQNIFSRPPVQQQPPGNAQADTPAAPTTAAPNRPIIQAIQNNPIYQGVVSLIRPQTTTKAPAIAEVIATQAQAAEKPAEPAVEGSNAVPTPNANIPVETKPQKDDTTVTQTIAPSAGPIQQMVQKNPIVQGISSAVQRIQNTIGGNTDKPREADDRGFLPIPVHGHGGHGGNNNDIDGLVAVSAKCETVKDDKQATAEEPPKTEKAEEKAPELKDELKPSEVPAKTE